MATSDLIAILPLILLAATPVAVMTAIAIRRHHGASALLAAAGMASSLLALPAAAAEAPRRVGALIAVDGLALYFTALVVAGALVVLALAHGYFRARPGQHEELYILLPLATLGAAVLAAGTHFVSLFLGLEILSISLYALIAYPRRAHDVEAGIKYLILAAASSAFLLFGMALLYARHGMMELRELGAVLAADQPIAIVGLGMVLVGVGFKLALVPFHAWAPDVYAGAPAPIAAFVSSVSKAGVFAMALRLVIEAGPLRELLFLALALVAIASMLVGNLLALLQRDVKRLLAYSSIAHLGYALVALLASGEVAVEAGAYYLGAYVVTILAAFGVVTVLSEDDRDAQDLDLYRGLFWSRPWLAALFTASLLSLAGIPLTPGFLGKFYLLLAGAESELWAPVFALVAGSVIGLFYYLRVVFTMFAAAPAEPVTRAAAPGWAATASLAALVVPLLVLGVFPQPVVEWIRLWVAGA
ncbi:MAG TPA: NADH-quinone oxidoreductase subunit N [Thermoanaerobaculia bacterium]|nr:NADH-quinone oxidoreductase subunit N [Thermoanaerobaculia bacterium]